MAIRTGIADLTRRRKYQFNFSEVASVSVSGGNSIGKTAVIDQPNLLAYFGELTSPGTVTKINLSNFTIASTVMLNSGENSIRSAILESGFAYFGMGTSPGLVVKVNLTTFTEVSGPVVFNSGENILVSAVIDTVNRLAYFGTFTSPGIVVKVNLATFTRVAAITLNSGENLLNSASLESGFAYFGTLTSPALVAKINLTTFTEVSGPVAFIAGENSVQMADIDPINRFAYFTTFTTTGTVVKVNLATFTRVGALDTNVNPPNAIILDNYGFAYCGSLETPGRIVKINLGTFNIVGTITLNLGGQRLAAPIIDIINGFVYFGSNTTPNVISKIAIV